MAINGHSPFLKWAGGKRWLVRNHSCVFPIDYNKYFEPFLGSGAVFFHLQPQNAILSDINKDLILTYQAIKIDWKKVQALLKMHAKNHSHDYYYRVRNQRPKTPFGLAARLIYLNRTCWNGLYRVNSEGVFNVPIGTKQKAMLDTDDFQKTALLLSRAKLVHSHFRRVIQMARKGDLVFADPPYSVTHNNNNFIKYNESIFSWEEQVELCRLLEEASIRGVHVVATNANHPEIRKLYESQFHLFPLTRRSVIAASPENRGVYDELLIRSFSDAK